MTEKNPYIIFPGITVLMASFSKFSVILLIVIILLLIALQIFGYLKEKREYENWVKDRYKNHQIQQFKKENYKKK